MTHIPGREWLWVNLFAMPGITEIKAVREPEVLGTLILVRFIIFDVLSRPLFEDLTHVFALAHAQSKKVLINLLHVIPQLLGP